MHVEAGRQMKWTTFPFHTAAGGDLALMMTILWLNPAGWTGEMTLVGLSGFAECLLTQNLLFPDNSLSIFVGTLNSEQPSFL